jgi:very-short-patch-repair endonuclease
LGGAGIESGRVTSVSRRSATADGQRHDVLLRSRDLSGIRSRGNSPLVYARYLLELRELIASIGAPCWAYGVTAGALERFDGFLLEPPFHAVVPRERSVNRIGHVIHRSRDISRLDMTEVDGVPTMSATRTLIDLAGSETRERLAIAIDSALRDRLTSEDFLHGRIVELRCRGRAGLGDLVSVLEGNEITRGGHSWLERRFLALLSEERLPLPQTQAIVGKRNQRLIRVDCRFPGTNVVVELLGYRFHRSVMQMQNDAERMNRMILDGLHPLQATYTDVASASPTMLASIREALE